MTYFHVFTKQQIVSMLPQKSPNYNDSIYKFLLTSLSLFVHHFHHHTAIIAHFHRPSFSLFHTNISMHVSNGPSDMDRISCLLQGTSRLRIISSVQGHSSPLGQRSQCKVVPTLRTANGTWGGGVFALLLVALCW